jgi:hypothetical protein
MIKLMTAEAGGDKDAMRYEPRQRDLSEKCSFVMALMPDCHNERTQSTAFFFF